jgi:hypothetical protein
VTPEEYAAQQALITAQVAKYVSTFGSYFQRQALSLADWLGLMNLLFPEIQRQRDASATLARTFYDSQRSEHHPNIPRNDVDLEGTVFDGFLADMEPARKRMSQADSPSHALTLLTMQATRTTENAGRRQIITAVQSDPEPGIIRGWAREATGRETCAWCLMLVSRGPVYMGADTAGLDLDDESAARMIAAGEDVSEFMEQWHTGCDCKVIPVFKSAGENWPGKAASDKALDLWNDAAREADQVLEDNPDKKSFVGGKWIPTTRNREAINALRRRIDAGDITASQFAALAAA